MRLRIFFPVLTLSIVAIALFTTARPSLASPVMTMEAMEMSPKTHQSHVSNETEANEIFQNIDDLLNGVKVFEYKNSTLVYKLHSKHPVHGKSDFCPINGGGEDCNCGVESCSMQRCPPKTPRHIISFNSSDPPLMTTVMKPGIDFNLMFIPEYIMFPLNRALSPDPRPPSRTQV